MNMTGKSCHKCAFWRKTAGPMGTCHARPPVPIMVGQRASDDGGLQYPLIFTYWPETPPGAFCGAFADGPAAVFKAIDPAALKSALETPDHGLEDAEPEGRA